MVLSLTKAATSAGGRSWCAAKLACVPPRSGPVAGTVARGKRMRVHKPAMDVKRRREVAAAAFEDINTDDDCPAPAGH